MPVLVPTGDPAHPRVHDGRTRAAVQRGVRPGGRGRQASEPPPLKVFTPNSFIEVLPNLHMADSDYLSVNEPWSNWSKKCLRAKGEAVTCGDTPLRRCGVSERRLLSRISDLRGLYSRSPSPIRVTTHFHEMEISCRLDPVATFDPHGRKRRPASEPALYIAAPVETLCLEGVSNVS